MKRVADIIREHHDAIVRLWTAEATRAASARGLDEPELKNIMPTYLASLATGEPLGVATAMRRKHVESHVAARLRQGFHVAEVVEEFALLGRCISMMWSTAPREARPDVVEVEQLFIELHGASAAVIELFSEHMRDDEQTEKRYLRLIQNVASEALEVDAASLRERLVEVLELVMEGLGAQGGLLLLNEPEQRKFVMVASAGVAREALARYVPTLETMPLAAQVPGLTGDEGTSAEDAEATVLKVDEDLHRSGIQALLGLRLATHHALIGVMCVGLAEARDFTARERRRLESLGEQLTVHLDNAKLYSDLRAKVAALQSERELRERFVSVLAHDLRGPLSAAKMGAQLLIRRPETLDERRDLARRIDQNIERTDRMVRDLLDANLIRAGRRLALQLAPCDLDVIARDVIEELSLLHGERFLLVAPEQQVRGNWSADQLRRALWNLVSNAVKYGASDAPITLIVARTEQGACVSVHNEGRMIPRADQQTLFEPFTRTRSAREGLAKGWGLGLTLVWGCARAHGGKVTVVSEESTGTTFTMELPPDSAPYQPRE
ncbi:GAF domain-containing sensor histidine kinase [Myxococcus llanfairpwllgwyngyllgogerychwyrndrobwllllantysiliogogogochensis]|uniref:histidine kinase n=1 Tax=Myxococcus llanfairpwllgwyngyllgogerychwyrndrobwllllantysiliogogogochensis TaxID=2590453 RepID=A0A540WRH6_9BACT|nr:ATP-binding protein [Myxococcus llanfairpwllgwyngyllgogerychwyrndrobwllllantysiliogogogochensis]TQF11609.1 GAF domain-containing sensor histidine kinase [Myxococcus llanfairpwllgwyngyllgogerychwyrndrobwllllantysiliogogogochensis]